MPAADTAGWQWLPLAGRGDYFNFIGIVVLASIVIAAYLRVLSLLAAASGLLNSFGGSYP